MHQLLLAIFRQSLPLSACARIWDVVLSEGERALFRAALALLGLLQPMLLAAGYEESVMLLQHLPQSSKRFLRTSIRGRPAQALSKIPW